MASEISDLTESIKEETAIMQVSRQAVGLCDTVKALTVIDQTTYNNATDLYKALVAMEKEITKTHEKVIQNWHAKHKAAVADRDKDLKPVSEAKVLVKSKAATWQDEQERIRLAEERRLAEIARKEAEEAARIAREQAEAAAKVIREQEEAERLRLAQEAEDAGATVEQVSEILDVPLYEPPPVVIETPVFVAPTVARTFEKATGFTVRWNYAAEVENLTLFIAEIKTNPTLARTIISDKRVVEAINKVISAQAKSHQDAFSIPGCKLVKTRV